MTKFLGEEWASGAGLAGTGWRGPALLAGDFWQVCRSRSPRKFQLLPDRWAEAFLCFRLIRTSGREEAWKTSWSLAPLGDEQTKGASGIWGTNSIAGPQARAPGPQTRVGVLGIISCPFLMHWEAPGPPPALVNLLMPCGCNSSAAVMLRACEEESGFLQRVL